MDLVDPLEIRPRVVRNAVLLGAGCATFTAIGLWMIVTEPIGIKLIGVISVLFFGAGGAIAVPKLLRRKVSLRLTRAAVTFVWPEGEMTVPWSEVESVRVVKISRLTAVGFRFTTPDAWNAGSSPGLAPYSARNLPSMRAVAGTAALLPTARLGALTPGGGGGHEKGYLADFARSTTIVEAMAASRKHFGVDTALGPSELDRSAAEFVELVRRYQDAAG
jgi:hypothetical protein